MSDGVRLGVCLPSMSRKLPRFDAHYEKVEDQRKLAKILLETGGPAPPPTRVAGARSGGDERALRGLPAIGRGVSGTMPGTDPVQAVLNPRWRVSKAGNRRPR